MVRPTILMLAGRYLPAFKAGGPIRNLANLVDALRQEFEFRVVAYDRDLGDREPFSIHSYQKWMPLNCGSIIHVKPGPRALSQVGRIVAETPHDLLYVSSLFDPVFGCGLVNRSSGGVLLAPHGQLDPGALSIKPLKKRLFLELLRRSKRLEGVVWQSTHASETEDIRREFPKVPLSHIKYCPNLPSYPRHASPEKPWKAAGYLKVAFLSRISPKKNLAFAIRSLREVVGNIQFTVYGPVEDEEYGAICHRLCLDLPSTMSVRFAGPIPHEEVHQALENQHLFFLPTLGENYGYAIHEALSAGCPVLISDRTPWRGLVSSNAGADLPLNRPSEFIDALQAFVDMDSLDYCRCASSALQLAREHGEIRDGLDSYRKLFRHAMQGAYLA